MKLHTRFLRFRLENGMFWQRSFPTPMDYKQETRLAGACMLILILIMLATGKLDADVQLVQEQMSVEQHQQLLLACVNQAHQGGNVGIVFDGKLIGVDCQVLSDKPHEGIRRM